MYLKKGILLQDAWGESWGESGGGDEAKSGVKVGHRTQQPLDRMTASVV